MKFLCFTEIENRQNIEWFFVGQNGKTVSIDFKSAETLIDCMEMVLSETATGVFYNLDIYTVKP